MSGWIKLHRKTREHWIWRDPIRFKWWIDLVMRAGYKQTKVFTNGQLITLQTGSFLTSELRLAESFGVGRKQIHNFLELLKKEGMIETVAMRRIGTIIKIVNYSKYQSAESAIESTIESIIEDMTEEQKSMHNNKNNKRKEEIKEINNICQSCQSQEEHGQDKDIQESIEACYNEIKKNINYDSLISIYEIKMVDELVDIIVDTIFTQNNTIRIDGEYKPRELVKNNFLKLDYNNIEFVIEQFKNITDRIGKKKQYIVTMLYNSRLESDSHLTNLVKHNMFIQATTHNESV